jgi:hypothetical protein
MPSTPTIDIEKLQTQVHELQEKALAYVKDVQGPVVDYVGKASETVASRLPEDRPAALVSGLRFQVDFAKKALDTQVAFAKSVIDAVAKPVLPAPAKRTVKAA